MKTIADVTYNGVHQLRELVSTANKPDSGGPNAFVQNLDYQLVEDLLVYIINIGVRAALKECRPESRPLRDVMDSMAANTGYNFAVKEYDRKVSKFLLE